MLLAYVIMVGLLCCCYWLGMYLENRRVNQLPAMPDDKEKLTSFVFGNTVEKDLQPYRSVDSASPLEVNANLPKLSTLQSVPFKPTQYQVKSTQYQVWEDSNLEMRYVTPIINLTTEAIKNPLPWAMQWKCPKCTSLENWEKKQLKICSLPHRVGTFGLSKSHFHGKCSVCDYSFIMRTADDSEGKISESDNKT